jgi:hypothetical protein
MHFFEKPDEEILEIANPIWDDFIINSNNKDYPNLSKHFSKSMLEKANLENINHQWETSEILTSLSTRREYLGCLRRGRFVTVLWSQLSFGVQGDYLARLVLGIENDDVKIFGATIT